MEGRAYTLSEDTDIQSEPIVERSHPSVQLPDASFLLHGAFEQDGFDLVVTNPSGEVVVVDD
ncbi:MAG TPA: hypothetical protein EYP91_19495, partial [Gammaproteobacteria bacterium]|nr:hypothetical protein [Gammaproteobacteria bacterium]